MWVSEGERIGESGIVGHVTEDRRKRENEKSKRKIKTRTKLTKKKTNQNKSKREIRNSKTHILNQFPQA